MSHADSSEHAVHDRDPHGSDPAQRIGNSPDDVVGDVHPSPANIWFEAGLTNLCHNAVDRHVHERPDQAALVSISSETRTEEIVSYAQLLVEVERMAAILHGLGVGLGDRVLVYMPAIPQTVIAMLATVRLGAIHTVVSGDLRTAQLAQRIDDVEPAVIVTTDAGAQGGQTILYKTLLNSALRSTRHPISHVLLVDRKLAATHMHTTRDVDYGDLRSTVMDAIVPCERVPSSHLSYTLFGSDASSRSPELECDTGAHAVDVASDMSLTFGGVAGDVFWCTSDFASETGHRYIVYGPLLMGMTTVLYEGLPARPGDSAWWSVVDKHDVQIILSTRSELQALAPGDAAGAPDLPLPSLKHLFLAGEPVGEMGEMGSPSLSQQFGGRLRPLNAPPNSPPVA